MSELQELAKSARKAAGLPSRELCEELRLEGEATRRRLAEKARRRRALES